MTRKWELSRDEAEYLIDVLESITGKEEGDHHRALYLATELRQLFGMGVYQRGCPPRFPALRIDAPTASDTPHEAR